MAGFSDYDSAGVHKFGLEIDNVLCKTIKSVDGLELKLDKVETKSNSLDGKPIHKAWPGNKQFIGTLTATRVMTDDPSWDVWFKKAIHSVAEARTHGSVYIYNQEGAPVREYAFKHAWPLSLKVTQMNASTPNPIEETITFVYEEIEIIPR
jgi:phage tail-like protein